MEAGVGFSPTSAALQTAAYICHPAIEILIHMACIPEFNYQPIINYDHCNEGVTFLMYPG